MDFVEAVWLLRRSSPGMNIRLALGPERLRTKPPQCKPLALNEPSMGLNSLQGPTMSLHALLEGVP